jgi:DNA-binding transcriptional MerR regulator
MAQPLRKAIELFNPKITIQTLNNWTKQGLLHKETRGGRVFFSQNEILEKRTILKKYNRTIQ